MNPPTLVLLLALAGSLTCPAKIGVELVAKGFERPVWAGMPDGVSDKLWVMEQEGRVWIVDQKSGKRADTPFLDIRKEVSRSGNEEGLLGLAFSPDFQKTGRYYVNYTGKDQHTHIVRFTSDNRTETDPSAAEELLRFKQDFRNHNGGWISFGPDGMLYIGNGDGGAANDPHDRAQSLDTFLGKILRIDVSASTGYRIPEDNPFTKNRNAKPEIWSYGVRNPWRCSFDRKTGDFWMGDVGQNQWEEINHMPRGKGAGANYGWRLREGDIQTPDKKAGGPSPSRAIEPVYVYQHGGGDNQGVSVTGGYVYRGPIRELQGRYLFADYQNPRIWSFRLDNNKAADFQDHTDELKPERGRITSISSFAEEPDGNLLIVSLAGSIYRIVER